MEAFLDWPMESIVHEQPHPLGPLWQKPRWGGVVVSAVCLADSQSNFKSPNRNWSNAPHPANRPWDKSPKTPTEKAERKCGFYRGEQEAEIASFSIAQT